MSDIGEDFHFIRQENKMKKLANVECSLRMLTERGLKYEVKSVLPMHVHIGGFDYWPATGLFIHQKTGKRGRGVFALISKLPNGLP